MLSPPIKEPEEATNEPDPTYLLRPFFLYIWVCSLCTSVPQQAVPRRYLHQTEVPVHHTAGTLFDTLCHRWHCTRSRLPTVPNDRLKGLESNIDSCRIIKYYSLIGLATVIYGSLFNSKPSKLTVSWRAVVLFFSCRFLRQNVVSNFS